MIYTGLVPYLLVPGAGSIIVTPTVPTLQENKTGVKVPRDGYLGKFSRPGPVGGVEIYFLDELHVSQQ